MGLRDIYKAENERAIVTIIPPSVTLGRELTEEEKEQVIQEINAVNYEIVLKLYKEGKLATYK